MSRLVDLSISCCKYNKGTKCTSPKSMSSMVLIEWKVPYWSVTFWPDLAEKLSHTDVADVTDVVMIPSDQCSCCQFTPVTGGESETSSVSLINSQRSLSRHQWVQETFLLRRQTICSSFHCVSCSETIVGASRRKTENLNSICLCCSVFAPSCDELNHSQAYFIMWLHSKCSKNIKTRWKHCLNVFKTSEMICLCSKRNEMWCIW